jgi:tripartite-type tricarboxylate transporter receptor subunit TctC
MTAIEEVVMKSSSRFSGLALVFVALALATTGAIGQSYPQKPVRAIVPFTAGAVDTMSRTIGAKFTEKWGQPVVIDNRPGAGGTIGTAVAAKAAPDGYTWLMATFGHAVNPTLYGKLPFDTWADFDPVILLATTPTVLLVHPSVPVTSLEQLLALAKARRDQMSFASAGNGSTTHLAGELFKSTAQLPIVHVPYKGSAPAMADLIGGRVQMAFDPLPSSFQHIRSGSVKPIAVTSAKRSALFPDVPTMAEAGLAAPEVNWWAGVLVPTGTPKETVALLNAEFRRILALPDVKERFASLGYELVGSSPEEFKTFLKAEMSKWGDVVKTANIRVQ